MSEDVTAVMQSVNTLVDEYRARCLWFLREDYYPRTTAEACRVLEAIERRGGVPESGGPATMALTDFQRAVCRLISRQRLESGESYIAWGIALTTATGASRISRDIDLFHDTAEAVAVSWAADRRLLESSGYQVREQRERESFVEAVVSRGADSVVMQWAADSAFRFFPLV